jgi:riboflavin-specific deaminase-like protein
MTISSSNRPRVTLHFAQTLDGRIATRTGCSQWISGPGSLRLAHELRAAHDAVMVGAGTVCSDNPRLTVRHAEGRSPLRIIVDSTLRLPLTSYVLTDRRAATIVVAADTAEDDKVARIRQLGVDVLLVASDSRGVDISDLLSALSSRGVSSVLVEGGNRLLTSLLTVGAVDRIVICIAPKIIGEGLNALGDLGIDDLSQAITFAASSCTSLEGDLIFDGIVAGSNS